MANENVSLLNYDKIVDNLLFFENGNAFSLNVKLYRHDKAGNRQSLHKELPSNIKHNSTTVSPLYSIYRGFTFYYTIGNTKSMDNGALIGMSDIPYLSRILDKVLAWFYPNSGVFIDDNGIKNVGEGTYDYVEYRTSGAHPKLLRFQPAILSDEGNPDNDREGIILRSYNIETNTYDEMVMDAYTFGAFYNYIVNTDMYNAAITLINYVKIAPYELNQTVTVSTGYNGATTSTRTGAPKRYTSNVDYD